MKHRKLFPASLAETNYSTTDCSGLCDPACPYNCYPDYYYLSPPPPPPPPKNLTEIHHISPFVIGVVSFLAGLFILFSYYVIKTKPWTAWCGNRNSQAETGWDEEFIDENRVDHPVWFIATVGLQPSVINSISVWKYKKGEGVIEGTECSVCLSEFQEEEMLRLLPKCNHAFHVSCIDTWLRSHTNCPLCRAGIVFDVIRNAPVTNSETAEGISGVDSGTGGELDVGSEIPVRIGGNFENRGGAEDGGEAPKEKLKLIRSASVDSLGSANLGLALEDDRRSDSGVNSSGNSSSISQFLRVSPVPMKRSFSCSGRFLRRTWPQPE